MEPAIRDTEDDPPPLLRKWRRVYFAVGCYVVVLIGGLYLITRLLAY